jgi:hypothetical protein
MLFSFDFSGPPSIQVEGEDVIVERFFNFQEHGTIMT